jgi:hypothetical protein
MRLTAAKTAGALRSSVRDNVSWAFTLIEDVVYVGLGLLLAGAALVLLVSLAAGFWRGLTAGALPLSPVFCLVLLRKRHPEAVAARQ